MQCASDTRHIWPRPSYWSGDEGICQRVLVDVESCGARVRCEVPACGVASTTRRAVQS